MLLNGLTHNPYPGK